MKNKKIIIIIVLIISIGIALYSMYSMSTVLTPYVSFKEAIESGDHVQVIGKLNRTKPVIHEEGNFTFSLNDGESVPMDILCKGIQPLNFEEADRIVVQGSYNREKKIFEADKILVKCPSKYIGTK